MYTEIHVFFFLEILASQEQSGPSLYFKCEQLIYGGKGGLIFNYGTPVKIQNDLW